MVLVWVGPFHPSISGNSHILVGWSTLWHILQVEGEISVSPRLCMGVL